MKVFPVGTRFVDSEGRVLVITHYSSTEVRAYCDVVCDAYPLPPVPAGAARRGIRVTGGRSSRLSVGATPMYFEPVPQHTEVIIELDPDEDPEVLSARMCASNEAVAGNTEHVEHYRKQADNLEQSARRRVYAHMNLDIGTTVVPTSTQEEPL